ncbi:MAG: efflux RND transporter periplasmic adaptor subunit [Gammaproteobacteria bacterium]
MNDKSELLDQLTIDRSAPEATGWSIWAALGLAAVTAVAGAFVALTFFAPEPVAVANKPAAAPEAATTASRPASAPSAPASTPAAAPAKNEDARILNASGYITARRIATVSSEITGLIVDVNVEEGMIVEAGQVLARLDNALASVNLDLAKAQVNAQRAQINNIQASLDEANRVLERAKELETRSLVSEAELSRAVAQVDAFTAQIKSARANTEVSKFEVQRQQERLEDHIVRAPFAGVVTVKNAQKGEIISPGSAGGGFTRTGICTIVDMDSLEIEVDVNESFIGRVFTGQTVEANLDAYPDWNIPAEVIAIIPTADRAKATVRVRIGILEKDARILPDMGVRVAFMRDTTT